MRSANRLTKILLATSVGVLVSLALAALPVHRARVQAQADSPDPWSSSQTVQPADLALELAGAASAKPTVICVGFRPLYQGAHIPGATFHGSTSKPEAVVELKTWAQPLPRSTNLVVYCGCCPMPKCPNIRPAFTALRDMGFTHLRVLILPNDLNTDWTEKGYPVSKGN
jgi:thiosulfate/3-mercaptopyruvate sulfurtransferase